MALNTMLDENHFHCLYKRNRGQRYDKLLDCQNQWHREFPPRRTTLEP